MVSHKDTVSDLVHFFELMPGLGKKKAHQVVVYLLENKDKMTSLLRCLSDVSACIKRCSECNFVDVHDPCSICSLSGRRSDLLCVVESISSVFSFEDKRIFDGLYHIVDIDSSFGCISDRSLLSLYDRIERHSVKEIIIAFDFSLENCAMSLYLKKKLAEKSVKVMTLAQGIPSGCNISNCDKDTLTYAFENRRLLDG